MSTWATSGSGQLPPASWRAVPWWQGGLLGTLGRGGGRGEARAHQSVCGPQGGGARLEGGSRPCELGDPPGFSAGLKLREAT